ncbi:MAG: 4'-phosphopantetheinyl transferase superfamily protein [Tabrizicola sp.]|nr:4'-phosphopantetheinyl transferase superfamily protein [Tabrizicola sp.]
MAARAMQSAPGLPDGIEIFACPIGDDTAIALPQARDLLSDHETERAARFRFDRDRNRYIRGRAFLRQRLGAATGVAPARLVLAEGPRGKPGLVGHDLRFNLSHSGDVAVLALSRRGPVGIDLEFIDRQADTAGLAQRCFLGQELDVLNRLSPTEHRTRFFAFWTAKEARMKLTGEGMWLAPDRITLDLRAGWPVGYLLPRGEDIRIVYPEIGLTSAMCCLAYLEGAIPDIF